MAVERRSATRRYLYGVVTIDGRQRKRYAGPMTDPVVALVARAKALRRALAAGARAEAEHESDAYGRLEPLIRLAATRTARCAQREKAKRARRPTPRGKESPKKREHPMPNPPDSPSDPMTISREEFDALVERATAGDEEALAELRQVLRANPAAYQRLGDLACHAQLCLAELLGRKSVAARESVLLALKDLRAELLGEGASPLQRLLIEQVLTTWIDIHVHQLAVAEPHPTQAIADRWAQRLDRAQKRHLAAVRALAEIRLLK